MKKIFTLLLMTAISYANIAYDGEEHMGFDTVKNPYGLVLTATGNLYALKGYGAGTEAVDKGFSKKRKGLVLYMGKDCEAYAHEYGNGYWEWDNGGFAVVFKTKRFSFGRQEIDMHHAPQIDMHKCLMWVNERD